MKKAIIIAAALMMFAATAKAQVFLDDDDLNNNMRPGTEQPNLPEISNPPYGQGVDWYSPVGSGVVLLAGLAGAYLVGKRRKED